MAEKEAKERTLRKMHSYLLLFPVPIRCSIETWRWKVLRKRIYKGGEINIDWDAACFCLNFSNESLAWINFEVTVVAWKRSGYVSMRSAQPVNQAWHDVNKDGRKGRNISNLRFAWGRYLARYRASFPNTIVRQNFADSLLVNDNPNKAKTTVPLSFFLNVGEGHGKINLSEGRARK